MLEQTGHIGTYHATLFARKTRRPARFLHCHYKITNESSAPDTVCMNIKEGNALDAFIVRDLKKKKKEDSSLQ